MKSAYHRAAAYGFAAALAVAAAAAVPARAQQAATERLCSQLWPGDIGGCTPDGVSAHGATRTVAGKTPLQPLSPRSTVAERPWLKAAKGG